MFLTRARPSRVTLEPMLPFLARAKGSRASGAAGDRVWRPRLIRWEHSNHHLCAAKYPCTTGQVFHRRYRKTMAKVYTTLSGFSSSLYSEESLQRRVLGDWFGA